MSRKYKMSLNDHGPRGASCQKLINQNSLDTMIDKIKPSLDMQEKLCHLH